MANATEQHIASVFDRDLEAAQALIMKMGSLVEVQIIDAVKALEQRDEDFAKRVVADDKKIDALEELVDQEIARLIALRAPTASDLRIVLSILKISGNLERCGDYAKNIARRIAVLASTPGMADAIPPINRMAREVEQMMKDALDAYIKRDAVLAEEVRRRDVGVDQMFNGLFRELLTFMIEDPKSITACMHLHFIAKNIERMGDHVTSVAEQVIYLVEGKYPEDERPKDNQAPYLPEMSEG